MNPLNLLERLDNRIDNLLKRDKSFEKMLDGRCYEQVLRIQLRERILVHYSSGFKCSYCNRRMLMKDKHPPHSRSFSIDHDVPLSRGGKSESTNIVFCCLACNMIKFTKDGDEYREMVKVFKENNNIYKIDKLHRKIIYKKIGVKDAWRIMNDQNTRNPN